MDEKPKEPKRCPMCYRAHDEDRCKDAIRTIMEKANRRPLAVIDLTEDSENQRPVTPSQDGPAADPTKDQPADQPTVEEPKATPFKKQTLSRGAVTLPLATIGSQGKSAKVMLSNDEVRRPGQDPSSAIDPDTLGLRLDCTFKVDRSETEMALAKKVEQLEKRLKFLEQDHRRVDNKLRLFMQEEMDEDYESKMGGSKYLKATPTPLANPWPISLKHPPNDSPPWNFSPLTQSSSSTPMSSPPSYHSPQRSIDSPQKMEDEDAVSDPSSDTEDGELVDTDMEDEMNRD